MCDDDDRRDYDDEIEEYQLKIKQLQAKKNQAKRCFRVRVFGLATVILSVAFLEIRRTFRI